MLLPCLRHITLCITFAKQCDEKRCRTVVTRIFLLDMLSADAVDNSKCFKQLQSAFNLLFVYKKNINHITDTSVPSLFH